MSLADHLESGASTVARAWWVRRADGTVMGFTDHDRDLVFEGVVFRASSGLTARALQQTTGLAVDNSEAAGALSDAALTEEDILAGRYDFAELAIWWVNWADVGERRQVFRGTIGEVTRAGGAFRAELRGLGEALGRSGGRVYQPQCDAVLGDAACRFDILTPGYSAEVTVEEVSDGEHFRFAAMPEFEDRWFEKGRAEMLSGRAAGLAGTVKADRLLAGGAREVVLWQRMAAEVVPGDVIRLVAGCDKRPETCRLKFANFVNFRGFPHVPGDDWMMAVPRKGARNDGGRLRR